MGPSKQHDLAPAFEAELAVQKVIGAGIAQMYSPDSQGAAGLGELKAAALRPRADEQISHLRFSPAEELLWAGTESGSLYTMCIPELERYSTVKAHKLRISEIVPLPPAVGDGTLSISADTVRYHSSGGLPHFTYEDVEGRDITSCALDPQTSQKAILGRLSGKISVLDVSSGRITNTVGPKMESIEFVRTPALRGMVAIGCSNGQVFLVDPRNDFKAEQMVAAHSGGLVAMDLTAGLMATSGLGTRQGQLVQDTIVKVYDLRSTARVMTTFPFTAGPSLLRFHPRFSGTLLVAAASGIFTMAQTQGAPYAPLTQVDTEGDLLVSADFSSSGECLAFGGSGGFVHLWGYSQGPQVNQRSTPLEIPPVSPEPYLSLNEDDSFAAVPLPYPAEGKLLSEWEPRMLGKLGMPPRVVDPKLLQDIKHVDFVTYIPNPHYRRGKPKGEATRLAAALRNTRVQAKPEVVRGPCRSLLSRKITARSTLHWMLTVATRSSTLPDTTGPGLLAWRMALLTAMPTRLSRCCTLCLQCGRGCSPPCRTRAGSSAYWTSWHCCSACWQASLATHARPPIC